MKELVTGLGDFQVTDAGLARLKAFRNLQFLDLQNSKVTARGLGQLKGLTNLTQLWLEGTAISPLEKDQLREAMPNLGVIR